MCDNCSKINHKYTNLVNIESMVCKVLAISETTQMARVEQLLRQYTNKHWDNRRNQAATVAKQLVTSGKTASQVYKAVGIVMSKWSKDVIGRFNKDTEKVYKLARKVGMKKAKGKTKESLAFDTPNFADLEEKEVEKATVAVSFDLADDEAIAVLKEHNTFWIGEHYNDNVSNSIATITREVMAETGESRRVAAIAMEKHVREQLGIVTTPGGFNGTSIQYFEGLTSNALTVARVYGQLRSFEDAGVDYYEIVNPQDSRTCQVCAHLDGKVFSVQQGVEQYQAEANAASPEDIKEIHPWRHITQLTSISSNAGYVGGKAGIADSKALAGAGAALPPYHFRCRCTVDMVS